MSLTRLHYSVWLFYIGQEPYEFSLKYQGLVALQDHSQESVNLKQAYTININLQMFRPAYPQTWHGVQMKLIWGRISSFWGKIFQFLG